MSNTDDRLEQIFIDYYNERYDFSDEWPETIAATKKAKQAILKEYKSKQEFAEAIDSCYQYEITDLELAEHRGEKLIVISAAELRKKLNLTIKESKS